jgi:hypothetical protein
MSYFITVSDIQELKPISSNVSELKALKPFILEAQEFELRPFLGEEFYIAFKDDFDASPSLSTYEDLFNGVTYTYSGKQYQHEGLKAMLIYYAYARYLSNSQSHSTAFGMVQKVNENSQPISEKTLTRLVSQAVAGAKVYEQRVKDYLIRNSATYTLYECVNKNYRSGGLRITSIGGNK